MMYSQLYQYLIQYKELSLPGIGTFLLERKPAETDFPNRKINPPAYSIALQPGGQVPVPHFFNWLSLSLGISNREAIFRFNDFAIEMKRLLSEGALIRWNGMGTLNKGLGGDVKFTPSAAPLVFERPVTAEKVIRERSEHMVRVGDDEKTSAEMTEMLNQQEEKRSYWWVYALVVGILSIGFTAWYISSQGADIHAIMNSEKLVPVETGVSYQVLP